MGPALMPNAMHFPSLSSKKKNLRNGADNEQVAMPHEATANAIGHDDVLGLAISRYDDPVEERSLSSLGLQMPESSFRVSCIMPALKSRFSILQDETFPSRPVLEEHEEIDMQRSTCALQAEKRASAHATHDQPRGTKSVQPKELFRGRPRSRLLCEPIVEELDRPGTEGSALARQRLQQIKQRTASVTRTMRHGLRTGCEPERPSRTLPLPLSSELGSPSVHIPALAMQPLPQIPQRTGPRPPSLNSLDLSNSHRTTMAPPVSTALRTSVQSNQDLVRTGASAAYGPLPILPSQFSQQDSPQSVWSVPSVRKYSSCYQDQMHSQY